MTPRNKALLFSPPIIGLLLALGWAVADRMLPKGWPVKP